MSCLSLIVFSMVGGGMRVVAAPDEAGAEEIGRRASIAEGTGVAVRVVVSDDCFSSARGEAERLGTRLLARHLHLGTGRPVRVEYEPGERVVRGDFPPAGATVMMMTADEYLTFRQRDPAFQPLMMTRSRNEADRPGSVWVLIAHEAAPVRPHLVGIAEGGQGRLPRWWFNAWQQDHPLPAGVYPRLVREPDAEIALLRTFLGQTQACVVPESALIQATLENPELGRRCVRLAESPPFPGLVLGLLGGGPVRGTTERLREVARALGTSAQGRALASLLKVEAFVPFNTTLSTALEKIKPAASTLPPKTPARRGAP